MHKVPHNEVNEICDQLGEGSPKSIKQVFGGDIHNSWQIQFANSKFFLKRNERKVKFLKFEEYCLRNLQKYINHKNLVVPKIIAYLEINKVELLLITSLILEKPSTPPFNATLGSYFLISSSKQFILCNSMYGGLDKIKSYLPL